MHENTENFYLYKIPGNFHRNLEIAKFLGIFEREFLVALILTKAAQNNFALLYVNVTFLFLLQVCFYIDTLFRRWSAV